MSFSGSDSTPICDVCNTWFVYDAIVPWPLPGADRWPPRELFVICQECVQNLILEATRGPARRWLSTAPAGGRSTRRCSATPRRPYGPDSRRIQDESRNEWNARHDAEAARRLQQEGEMAAQFRRELDGLDKITGRR